MGSMVVSAALALAQRDGWSGEQLLRGLVGGYEMGAFLGTAIRADGTFNTHFRASGLIGAFAVAAAAVTASYVDEETTINALSLAVNMAAGINEWAWAGGQEIFIHNGIASRAGITSFDLARSGVKASDTVLEGKDGFFEALKAGDGATITFRDLTLTSSLGSGILGVRFKPAACCNFTQTSSSIAVKVARAYALDIDQVRAVNIITTMAAITYPGCDNAGPLESPSQGKLSIQFGVCAALVHASLDEESLMSVHDPRVAALMTKCTLMTSAENDAGYVKGLQPASVEVILEGGTLLQESAPDVPWLDGPEVMARFLREIAPMASGEKGERMLELCQGFQVADMGNKLFA
jgi:2-methylcitrate dehydratase PrpD